MGQRKSVRYEILAQVMFQWDDGRGVKQRETGITRDISTGGLYITSLARPHLGADIYMEITLPPLEVGGRSIRWNATGKVTRLDHIGNGFGFAVIAGSGISNKSRNWLVARVPRES